MPIEDFIMTNMGAEVFLAGMAFISFVLILWAFSKFFDLKKQDFLTAFRVSLVSAGLPFIIRSMNIIFGLPDPQKVPINILAMTTEIVVLMLLIKKIYGLKWGKTLTMWIIANIGRWFITGIIGLIIVIFFTDILTDTLVKMLA